MTQYRLEIGKPNHSIALATPTMLTDQEFANLSGKPFDGTAELFAKSAYEGNLTRGGATYFTTRRGAKFESFALSWRNSDLGDPAEMQRDVLMAFEVLVTRAGLNKDQGLRGHVYVEFEGAMVEENAMNAILAERAEAKRKAEEAENEKMRQAKTAPVAIADATVKV